MPLGPHLILIISRKTDIYRKLFTQPEGSITIEDVRTLHRRSGVRIWAGAYAKDEPSIDLAVNMGAELITCNNPDEVLSILRKKKLHR